MHLQVYVFGWNSRIKAMLLDGLKAQKTNIGISIMISQGNFTFLFRKLTFLYTLVTSVNIIITGIFIVSACKHLGQFLPDRYDACRYQVCSYGEPWKDEYGNLRLISMNLQCPPGTAVPYTYKGGFKTPCTSFSANCHASKSFIEPTCVNCMTGFYPYVWL